MKDNPLLKKWWFWAIIILFGVPFVLGIFQGIIEIITGEYDSAENTITNQISNTVTTTTQQTYTLTGEILGQYGKKVTLNANTDMPVDKYLYKIPAGKYKATTTKKKVASFYIVKDKIKIDKDNDDYPECLDYVGSNYSLTAGNDETLEKIAVKETEIELKEDESIYVINNDTITFLKID